jgi:hypothetical protein
MIAATGGTAASNPVKPPPEQMLVNPAVAGIMPATSARCPPADFGRRADESDDSRLDVRQECVLLGLVPAMDLVDEQDRADVVKPSAFQGLCDDDPQISLPGQDG